MTNAQKIRKMDDAEMAAWFTHIMTCSPKCPSYEGCKQLGRDCYLGMYTYLRCEVTHDE